MSVSDELFKLAVKANERVQGEDESNPDYWAGVRDGLLRAVNVVNDVTRTKL
jgi:hypothetical protein